MEPSCLSGGMYGSMSSGMLGLEIPPHQQQNAQISHPLHLSQMGSYSHREAAATSPQQLKLGYACTGKSKQTLTLSDDDEPGSHGDDGDADGKRKFSPWHRMKWTDMMVRLLIAAVFYFGDEGGGGSDCNNDPKKKSGGGLLQKKGKWKSVSRAMMEKGFYVSPQQCEDKFNDLNKRYKRVNDILGKGTACLVVENQNLLETMDLTPKTKEEVKKLLNSKHLFFREMCAYHNSCGHGVGGTSSGGGVGGSSEHHSPEVAGQPHVQQKLTQQQACSHSSENAAAGENSGRMELVRGGSCEEEFDDDDDDDDDDSEDDEDDDEEEILDHEDGHHDHKERILRKRPRNGQFSRSSALVQQLSSQLKNLTGDGSKSAWEKRRWVKLKLLQLEEQQVSYQMQGFELEKQRMKWVKFSGKKERDMERAKLENERRRLENERMMLLVRQKELELADTQHQQQQQLSSNRRSDPSSITG